MRGTTIGGFWAAVLSFGGLSRVAGFPQDPVAVNSQRPWGNGPVVPPTLTGLLIQILINKDGYFE